MVSFIHIANRNDEESIVKNGIRSPKHKTGVRGVYAVPVIISHLTTHQWARELKRRGIRSLRCVQFRIPDGEYVLAGKYNGEKLQMTASEAAAAFLKHTDPMGLEAIVPRSIIPKEITRTHPAPRITGWRYYAAAKGKKPTAGRKHGAADHIPGRVLNFHHASKTGAGQVRFNGCATRRRAVHRYKPAGNALYLHPESQSQAGIRRSWSRDRPQTPKSSLSNG